MRKLPRNFFGHQHGMGARPGWPLVLPAEMVLPLLRYPLGYKMVQPGTALVRALGLIALPAIGWWLYVAFTNNPPPANIGQLWLCGFAVLSFLATLAVFLKRLWGLCRGENIHQEEAGYSWLAWHTALPVPLTEQLIVPGALAVSGWILAHTVSFDLGWWLILSGASLAFLGNWEMRRQWAAMRTVTDGMISAQTSGWRVEQHDQQTRKHNAQATGQEPEFAEMADAPLAPDAMSFRRGGNDTAPEFMTWFRKRRTPQEASARESAAPPSGRSLSPRHGEPHDFADLQ